MDILKTPQQKLLEEAGMTPASPGMVMTPLQLLLRQSGAIPRMASGGSAPSLSVEDMRAQMIANKYEPSKFKIPGTLKKYGLPLGITGVLTAGDIGEAIGEAQKGNYSPAAVTTGAIAGGTFLPLPAQLMLMLGLWPRELGASTLDEYRNRSALPGSVLPAQITPTVK
jgi:hypothetical protein